MPGHRTHTTAAVGAAAAALLMVNWRVPIINLLTISNGACLVASLYGGLFPDIDIKSRGQKWWYRILLPLLGAALLARHTVFICVLSALAIIPPLLPHRGITHELWFVLLAPLGAPFLVSVYQPAYLTYSIDLYIYFVLGAITHLILDLGPLGMLRRSLPGITSKRSKRR